MDNCAQYMQQFDNYQWLLRSLNAKNTEYKKIISQISQGLTSQDMLKPDWETEIKQEIDELKEKLHQIEDIIDSIPDTAKLIPCKIFLRLYYIIGCSMTETALEMNVSLSTLRRIKNRCEEYFNNYPPLFPQK